MSDLFKHVLVGDILGRISASTHNNLTGNIITAFSLGIASHAVMDMLEPDYTANWFNKSELIHDIPYILFQISGISWFAHGIYKEKHNGNKHIFLLRIIAIIGAIIPDIIDGIYSIINPSAWYAGQLLFPWHRVRPHQSQELMSMWTTMFLTGLLFVLHSLSVPIYKYFLNKTKTTNTPVN